MTSASTGRVQSRSAVSPAGAAAVTLASLGAGLGLGLLVAQTLGGLVVLCVGGAAAVGLALATTRLRFSPPLALGGALALAGVAFQRKTGLQPEEIAFGLYYGPYLAGWYVLRLGVYREPLVWSFRDAAAALWLMWLIVHIAVGLVAGAEGSLVFSDVLSYSMFGFYFPAREVVARYRHGARLLAGCLLFMAAAALLRNFVTTQQAVASAEAAWEIARLRTTANEMVMTSGAVLCAAIAARARRGWVLAAAALGFALLTVGVVITQWRAYYVSLALGVVLVAALGSGTARVRILALSTVGLFVGSAVLYLVLGDAVQLLAIGLLDRLLSIGTASQADLSLINRFYETRAALAHIAANPVIGHGLGTTFPFFDIIDRFTWVKPYAHNGYVTLWFKFGAVGLATFLLLWGRTLWEGFAIRRETCVPEATRIASTAALAILVALIPSFWVSAPFGTGDTALCMTLLFALVGGTYDRSQLAVGARSTGRA